MLSREQILDLLLEQRYGLLDEAAEAQLQAALAQHPEAAALQAEAERTINLLARAAKVSFPQVKFAKPPITPAQVQPAVQAVWTRWAIAVALLLACGAISYPVGQHVWQVQQEMGNEARAAAELHEQRAALEKLSLQQQKERQEAIARVRQAHEEWVQLNNDFLLRSQEAERAIMDRQIVARITGPETFQSGASNEYRIDTLRVSDNQYIPARLGVRVLERTSGKVIFEDKDINSQGSHKLSLPPDLAVKAVSDLSLEVTAYGQDGELKLGEPLRLATPVYVTHLTTDKPMYQPGETVRWRSLTLNRASFTPPQEELRLKYELKDPLGAVVLTSIGAARLNLQKGAKHDPLLGPDKQPLRGIGAGEFAIPGHFAGGTYTLTISEEYGKFPPQTRKFTVNKYQPETLNKELEFDRKSYGPGDEVVAVCKVSRAEGGVLVGVTPTALADVDGRPIAARAAATDSEGRTRVVFTLPKKLERGIASLAVTFRDGDAPPETLVKPVPLVIGKLFIELFPEGGELIAGVPNRVYFAVRTMTDKPAELVGELLEGKGENAVRVTELRTLNDEREPGVNQGLGVFSFTPEEGKSYTLKIHNPSGVNTLRMPNWAAAGRPVVEIEQKDGRFPLPNPAKNSGVVLSIPAPTVGQGDALRVQVTSVGTDRALLVGAYCRGRLVDHQRLIAKRNQMTDVSLQPGPATAGGVTRVTVFEVTGGEGEKQFTPVAERLTFRHVTQKLNLGLTPDRSVYTPGSNVGVRLEATNEGGQPVPAIVMLGVVNQSVITMADEKTARQMPTHLLLSGEVRRGEELEHADFLLTDHPKAPIVLDMLLGTQGWRRFAEQRPEEFRNREPAEAERFLVSIGQQSTGPKLLEGEIQRLEEEFKPKLAEKAAALNAARETVAASRNPEALAEQQNALNQAQAEYKAKLAAHAAAMAKLNALEAAREEFLRWAVPAGAGCLALLGVALIAVALRRSMQENKGYVVAGGGAMVGAILLLAVMVLGLDQGQASKRSYIAALPRDASRFQNDPNLTEPAVEARELGMGFDVDRIEEGGDGKFGEAGGIGMPRKNDKDENEVRARQGGGRGRQLEAGLAPAVPAPQQAAMAAAAQPTGPADDQKQRRAGAAAEFPQPPKPKNQPAPAPDAKKANQQEIRKELQEVKGEHHDRAADKPKDFGAQREKANLKDVRRGKEPEAANARPLAPQADAIQIGANRGPAPGKPGIDGKLLEPQIKPGGFAAEREQFARRLREQPVLPFVVREYAHISPVPSTSNDGSETRSDFTETVYWHPAIVLPEDGRIEVKFHVSDAVTRYRMLAAAHSLDGRLGAHVSEIEVRKPFSIDAKLPVELTASDRLDLSVAIVNDSPTEQAVTTRATATGLSVQAIGEERQILTAGQRTTGRYALKPNIVQGTAVLTLDGQSALAGSDRVERTLKIVPEGFPFKGAFSDLAEGTASFEAKFPDFLPGTLRLRATAYPSTLATVQKGLEGLLGEPYGCFEQTSATSYPNLLILDYLRTSGTPEPAVARRANDLIARGYTRLIGFECLDPKDTRRGYEWFGGRAAPHEALTAYGLMQFTDMSRVHKVDPAMLKRTRDYLLAQRDGKGGFKRNPAAIDTYGRASEPITNAYILWAISEADRVSGEKADLDKELAAVRKTAEAVQDDYLWALIANTLINLGDTESALAILKPLADKIVQTGMITGKSQSITGSTDRYLQIEATSLALLAMIKAKREDVFAAATVAAANWLGKQRDGSGAFGTTQSTVLALKALILHTEANKRPAKPGEMKLFVGEELAGQIAFGPKTADSLEIVIPADKAEALVKRNGNKLRVELTNGNVMPVVVDWSANTLKPVDSDTCAVRVTTQLDEAKIPEGGTVGLNVTVENTTDKGHGMVTAIIGLPAGLKLPEDFKQLKEMTELRENGTKPGLIGMFEVRGRELILYWRDIAPKARYSVRLTLIGNVAGEFRGPASRAYLYYNADHKHWADPLSVTISPK